MKKFTPVVIPDHHKDNARAVLEEAIYVAPDTVIALCFWSLEI